MNLQKKQKILDVSIELLNELGYMHVTLEDIANKANITLEQLAYFFPSKQELIDIIYHQLVIDLREKMTSFRAYPDLLSIDRQMRAFHHFLKKYRFFYVDMLDIERSHPKIAKEHREHINFQIEDIHNMLIFNVSKGILQSNVELGIYRYVAHNLWLVTSQWSRQIELRGVPHEDTADELANSGWSLIKGFFTEHGKIAYKEMCATKKLLAKTEKEDDDFF